MEPRLFVLADHHATSFHGVDLAAHLASGATVSIRHVAVLDPATAPLDWGWPCRVFEIAGRRVDGLTVRRFQVVEEHPAHLALGPYGRHVAEILDHPVAVNWVSSDLRARRDNAALRVSW